MGKASEALQSQARAINRLLVQLLFGQVARLRAYGAQDNFFKPSARCGRPLINGPGRTVVPGTQRLMASEAVPGGTEKLRTCLATTCR